MSIRKTIPLLAFGLLFVLSACSKKPADVQIEPTPAPVPVQEEKADSAQDAKPAEAAAEALKANEENKAEPEPEPEKAPEPDDNHTDLALDKECVVTHCKNYKGPGRYWLDCDTEDIVEAGFAFGDKVASINYKKGKPVYRTYIEGRGDNCGSQGHDYDKCYFSIFHGAFSKGSGTLQSAESPHNSSLIVSFWLKSEIG